MPSLIFWALLFIVAVAASVPRPWVGFCFVYVFFVFCDLRFDMVPVLHTPFGILAAVVAVLGLRARDGRMGFGTSTHLPWFLMTSALLLFGLAQHGDPEYVSFRVRTYVIGMWPFILAGLTITTPRIAQRVLASAMVVIVALASMLLFGIAAFGADVLLGDSGTVNLRDVAATRSGFMTLLSYPKLVSISACAPVMLALTIESRLKTSVRIVAGVAWGVMVFSVLLSSYSAPLAGLLFGTLVLLFIKSVRRGTSLVGLALVGLIAVGGYTAVVTLPDVARTLDRVRNPQEDSSGSLRLMGIQGETAAFFEAPIYGHGVADSVVLTPEGNMMVGHNSVTRDAASFGLVFLIPFVWLLWALAFVYLRLIGRLKAPSDRAIVEGMLASYFVSIATGFITPTFGDAAHDAFFWTFASIALFWNHWRRRNPDARMIQWELERPAAIRRFETRQAGRRRPVAHRFRV